MTTSLTWNVDQGATFRVEVQYNDGTGAPVDLTGYDAKLQVRQQASDPDPALVTLTVGDGLTLGDDGQIVIEFSDEKTASWTFRSAVFDLLVTTDGGDKYRLLQGALTVSPGVTR